MQCLHDINTTPGEVVHFPCNLRGDVWNENLFLVELLHPEVQNGVIKYNSVKHLFTEKELNRAAVRYYSDCDLLLDAKATPGVTTVRNGLIGYVGTRVYVGRNDMLATRFITQMLTGSVPILNAEKCVMLFTAREMQRSADRVCWLTKQINPSLLDKIRRFLHVRK